MNSIRTTLVAAMAAAFSGGTALAGGAGSASRPATAASPVPTATAGRRETWRLHVLGQLLTDQITGKPLPLAEPTGNGGADGVHLADANGDGLKDLVCPFEDVRRTAVFIHPGHARVKERWPHVTVCEAVAPESALLVDVDNDGAVDVITGDDSEAGGKGMVYISWAPKDPRKYMDPRAWKTDRLPESLKKGHAALQMHLGQIDGRGGQDILCGGKEGGLSWLEAPADPRDPAAWKCHPILKKDRADGRIRVFHTEDVDGDGLTDVLAGCEQAGVSWFKNPGPSGIDKPWQRFVIASWKQEGVYDNKGATMMGEFVDLDGDGMIDFVAQTAGYLFYYRQVSKRPVVWERAWKIRPPEKFGRHGKGDLAVGDLDGDGRLDIVGRGFGKSFAWWTWAKSPRETDWTCHVFAATGGKIDNVEVYDMDGDGDLDVITSEENGPQGVIWFENPGKGG